MDFCKRSSAKSIDKLADSAGNTDNDRVKAMAGVAGVLKARTLTEQGQDALDKLQTEGLSKEGLKGLGTTRAEATIGVQRSESNSQSHSEQSQGSTVIGNTVRLIATGCGEDSNIDLTGSDITATSGSYFKADNDFNIDGVAQQQSQSSKGSAKNSDHNVR